MQRIHIVLINARRATLALAVLLGACASGQTAYHARERTSAHDLVGEVRLPDRPVMPGDEVRVEALLTNRGRERATVETTLCRLEVQAPAGILSRTDDCSLYSTTRPIEPGDTIRFVDRWTVASTARPGRYAVRVRQALDQELWVRGTLVVARPSLASR